MKYNWTVKMIIAVVISMAIIFSGGNVSDASANIQNSSVINKRDSQSVAVDRIEIVDHVALTRDDIKAYVYYDVFDQNGNSIREAVSISWVCSIGTATVQDNRKLGRLTITNTTEEFSYGQSFILTGVDPKSGINVTQEIQVGMCQCIDTLEFYGVNTSDVNKNSIQTKLSVLEKDFATGTSTYYLLFRCKDQNGNFIDTKEIYNTNGIVFVCDNKLVVQILSQELQVFTVDNIDYFGLKLDPGIYSAEDGGRATITGVSSQTGAKSEFTVTTSIDNTFTIPTAAELVGTAQLDLQANGWCDNAKCTNIKGSINGPGTYAVSCNWNEVQDDPQNYCAVRIPSLDSIADYVTFSDVTVWIDGKVVDIPVIYGTEKDCRIQLWNCWSNSGIGEGFEVPSNFPKTFYEIKVQFSIGLRNTPRDWNLEAYDSYLISVNTSLEDYIPSKQPITKPVIPETGDLVGNAKISSQANNYGEDVNCINTQASVRGSAIYEVSTTWNQIQKDPGNYCAVVIPRLNDIADYVTFSEVTVWVDGEVIGIPVVYGNDKTICRIQLWNTLDGTGKGFDVPSNFPDTYYEIKIRFNIGLRSTPRDWAVEGTDSSLISINTSRSDYTPSKKPTSTVDNGSTPSPSPVTPTPTTPTPQIPTASDLKGTAQLDSQANGWCGNDDCTNVKAEINGVGTYVVSSNWDEVQEDYGAYCAMRISDLDSIADYVTFSDVTVWVDGKVVDIPVVYGGDKDCRIQLWNNWANDGIGAGCETPENLPDTFYEIKVQFTIGLRSTPRDWEEEALDSALISVNTSRANYIPQRKPASIQSQPLPEPVKKPETVTKKIDSVKASKTKVTVKKGKTVKLKFKVTRKNANTGCSVKNNGKYAKIKNIKKQGSDTNFSITVSVKGVKKGSTKIVVKLGKKTATVKLKIK